VTHLNQSQSNQPISSAQLITPTYRDVIVRVYMFMLVLVYEHHQVAALNE